MSILKNIFKPSPADPDMLAWIKKQEEINLALMTQLGRQLEALEAMGRDVRRLHQEICVIKEWHAADNP